MPDIQNPSIGRVVHYYETTPGITLAVARDTTGDQP